MGKFKISLLAPSVFRISGGFQERTLKGDLEGDLEEDLEGDLSRSGSGLVQF